jgi:DNA primase catalytic subunit
MRYSTLEEREQFYQKEFDLKKVKKWFNNRLNKIIFAIIIGRHTHIYPFEYRNDASTTILIDNYRNLSDFKKTVLEFRPESVYYDRNIYNEKDKIIGQEIAFDIDPENFQCPVHGTLEEKMKRHQGLSFCNIALNMIKEETARLYEELLTLFSEIRIVYSGRGFHIHILDKSALCWTYAKRKRLARKMKKKGFMIDEWVTSGGMRLIRLPYSLHGMVSRIVTPISIKELRSFDPVKDKKFIPRFLETAKPTQI